METRRPPRIAIIIAVVVLGIIAYYAYRAFNNGNNGQLKASGTIEATDVNVSPELAGKVKEVLVDEGQAVKAGDPLLTLDNTLLQAQRQQAAAGLEAAKSASATADATLASAQSQYDLALNASLAADKAHRTAQWVNSAPSDFNVPLWYFSQSEQMAAAQAEVASAQAALTDDQAKLTALESSAASSAFLKAENDLASAEASYNVANDLNNRVKNGTNIDQLTRFGLYQLAIQEHQSTAKQNSSDYLINSSNINQDLKDFAQQLFDTAKASLRNAQQAYDDAITTQGASDVLKARAQVSLDQERYYTALDFVGALQTGSQAPGVETAQNALNQAKAADDQAHTAVQQAQASLNLIDAQIAKLTIYAPIDGVILTRNVQPGEYVQPGAAVLSMANLGSLTITVYVPEDQYGHISLGQMATVAVDSFHGVTFNAQVSNISDQAEFTPRNVQTVEGRSSTVYAIKLTVTDPQGKLKPGMPADVTFITK
jgi:HlyD family secretion protein